MVLAGVPLKSRLLTMPLAHEAGGTEFHPGGKHWESQSDPEWKALAAWVSRGDQVTAPGGSAEQPFRYYLRVRYIECDAQKVVFNSRYGEYVDVAINEFLRAIGVLPEFLEGNLDFQLVKQTVEWKAPARFDQVLELSIAAIRLGTTSFTVGTTFRIAGDERVIVTVETVYVLVDAPDADEARAARCAAGRAAGRARPDGSPTTPLFSEKRVFPSGNGVFPSEKVRIFRRFPL